MRGRRDRTLWLATFALVAAVGCGKQAVDQQSGQCSLAGAGPVCKQTVAARCAAACGDIVSCAPTWAAAAEDRSSCGTTLVETTYNCGDYCVRAVGSADFQVIYYYDGLTGNLAAIAYEANGVVSCVAGPAGFKPPTCPDARVPDQVPPQCLGDGGTVHSGG